MSDEMAPKGLAGVVVEKTALSRVDGQKGELIYRGFSIDDLVGCSYEEVIHLFLHARLPTTAELAALDGKLKTHRPIPEMVKTFIRDTAKDANPMATLRTATSMLSSYLPQVEEPDDFVDRALALIAKIATVTAAIARVRRDQEIVEPNAELGHAENFLFMSRGEVAEEIIARTLDVCFILHADHSFNASTFTARVVASTESDMASAVVAAIGSLKGPLHGGANTAVMLTLQEIGELENVEPWLDKALAEKRKVMGFGHRVYKVMDPRAVHLKAMSREWGQRVGSVKWFEMSEKLEALMLARKNINPNVDFYSASTYFAMGIAPEMFTPIFAVARTLGWCAHVIEQRGDNRIFRPKAAYVGDENATFKPIDQR